MVIFTPDGETSNTGQGKRTVTVDGQAVTLWDNQGCTASWQPKGSASPGVLVSVELYRVPVPASACQQIMPLVGAVVDAFNG